MMMTMNQAYQYCSKQSDEWLKKSLIKAYDHGIKHQALLCAQILLERGYKHEDFDAYYDSYSDTPDVIPSMIKNAFIAYITGETEDA